MRIGLITNMMDKPNGGIGRYTENLVSNLLLIDRKNEYYLIHSNKKDYNFIGNYQEIRLPFFDSIPKKLITGTFLFEKICKDYKLDILHDLGQISPFFFKSKTKKVLTIHDLSVYRYPKYFSLYARTYSKLFPTITKNTNKIITDSNSSKRDIIKILGVKKENIDVVYLGIENKFKVIRNKKTLKELRTKYNLPRQYVLFIGTIEPRKNLVSLIKAFAKALPSLKGDIKLIIGGKIGWEKNTIYSLPEKLGINNRIQFIGKVEEEDLAPLYSLASTFVYPSLYEGFGLPPLEAMACGCPVITSNVSSLPEVVDDAAILINPYSLEDELGININRILDDARFRQKLIEKGVQNAKSFSWINTAKQTLEIYNTYKV
jgi:glycosyltransferase involved in cell wall biosynthesis